MSAYYNEIDPFAAQWLRSLIAAGHIAAGEVDERSIVDVKTDDIKGFTQCHFFAGIGVWSYALRQAGWPDDKPVWTGSCPCQPFSTAGKRQGTQDERHLWPIWYGLIRECKPSVVFGEQVVAAIGQGWLDALQADMERESYAVGKAVLGACSVGAPHIRQRLYFVADSNNTRLEGSTGTLLQRGGVGFTSSLEACELGNSYYPKREARYAESIGAEAQSECAAQSSVSAVAHNEGLEGRLIQPERSGELAVGQTGVAGFWSDAEWLPCRDGKFRPVEPDTFPLAHGAPARVGRLRGYGNAICAEVAKEFISAYTETQ